MSAHLIQRELETAAKTYLAAEVPALTDIKRTEDEADVPAPRTTYTLCPRAISHPALPGCYFCDLRIELRTFLNLYADRAAAATDHWALWDLIEAAMLMDDLVAGLVVGATSLGINGIADEHTVTQEATGGRLVSSITRQIFAVPQLLT